MLNRLIVKRDEVTPVYEIENRDFRVGSALDVPAHAPDGNPIVVLNKAVSLLTK